MDDEVLSPRAGLARRAEHPGPQLSEGSLAERVLVLFAENLVPAAVAATGAIALPFRAAQAPLWAGRAGGFPVTLVSPGVGAPATALAAEKVVAAGGARLVGVGYAGGLAHLPTGARISVAATLREEGTSRHYGFAGEQVPADPSLATALGKGATTGRVVTTDAPYRETAARVAAWRAAGAFAVDMETGGLLAVASFRGARAGALLVVTDRLGENGWVPAPSGSVDASVEEALRAALAALTG